jgi:HNH endonuclease
VTEQEKREIVRQNFKFSCGYCGVHENEVGNELELDHFQPRTAGGSDEFENLVYCCTACNRIKGEFWTTLSIKRLLHPVRDLIADHLLEELDGRLVALSETGAFHLQRLRLNRPPLIAQRQARTERTNLRIEVDELRTAQAKLQELLAARDAQIKEIVSQLDRLLSAS